MRQIVFIFVAILGALTAAGDSTETLKPYNELDEPTRALVDKACAGFGEERVLSRVRTTRRIATTTQAGASAGQAEKIAIDSISEYPDHHLVHIRAANGTMTLGIEESTSYMIPSPDKQKIKNAAIKLTPEERTDLIHYFSADPFFVVKMRHNPSYTFAAGRSLQLGDKSCQVLRANIDGLEIDWTIDLESGRLLRAEAAGEASEFSDWQQIGGVAVPFKVRTTKNGAFVSETKLAKYEVNPEIDAYTAFRVPDLWLARWKVPPTRGYYGTQTVYVFLYWLN